MDAITTFLTTLWNRLGAGWEWLLSEKGKDITGALANLATIIPFIAAIVVWLFFRSRRTKRQPTPIDPKANADILKRNQQRMLEKVRHMWVKGVLEKSLYRVARLELGYKESPEMVEHSWNLVVEQPGHQPEPIRAGTPMIELFDRFDKTLLILGAPGAGKTTLLLELARDLIKRAEKEPEHPIPVIFNLSSWALQRPPIADWLVDELRKRYDIPEKIARFWIENETILPLLDGLDEVAKEHRNTCVEAINTFREQNGLLPIAICSRIADYETLTTKLHLQHAVTVQPLTPEQVDRYLVEAGDSLEPVRKLVKDDKKLMELLDNPLMLSIMQLAFWNNADAATTLENGSIEKRRGKLFDTYIAAMFKRRKTSAPYKAEQTKQWISRLGKAMIQREQTVFYIEQLQPDLLYKMPKIIFSVLCIMSVMSICALITDFIGKWYSGLLIGFITGFGTELFSKRGKGLQTKILLAEGNFDLLEWIKTIRLSSALGIALVIGFNVFILDEKEYFILNAYFIAGWLISRLTTKNSILFHELNNRNVSNEGVRRSIKNASMIGLIIGLFIGLISSQNEKTIFISFEGGLTLGLLSGMASGGYAVIQHYVLRFLLWREGFAPLRYVRFLDYAAELLFLRKVGGGYIFVHRMIMEHFAAMEDGESAA
jgi:hypothetical protein